jgi:predicted house-cleaning noncanonical NTP pyrophosphatase (MazG superfamily)
MNIRHTIRKVLKEEEVKSLFRPISKLVEYFLSKDDVEKYVCDYKLEPGNFATGNMGKRYQRLKVTIYFDSGPGSKNWPMTQAVRYKEEDIMGELQDLILNSVGVYVDMYSSSTPNCEKKDESIIKEETQIPAYIRRRVKMSEDDIVNYLRKFSIIQYDSNKKIEVGVNKACRSTAYEILDSMHTSMDNDTFHRLEDELTEYLKNKYGERVKDFIQNFYNESGNDNGTVYIFRKHEEKNGDNGGRGFSQSFSTWNKLLMDYGNWFPSLDWEDIKETLDSMPDRKQLLIVEPGEKFNSTGYYFSLVKIKRDND